MSENEKLKIDLKNFINGAENLTKTAQDNAVEYINGIADKIQKFAADKVETAEEKVINLLDNFESDNNKKSPS